MPAPVYQQQFDQRAAVAASRGEPAPARTASSDSDPDSKFSFDDFLDIINPLQHLPVISTIYRAITHDTINPSNASRATRSMAGCGVSSPRSPTSRSRKSPARISATPRSRSSPATSLIRRLPPPAPPSKWQARMRPPPPPPNSRRSPATASKTASIWRKPRPWPSRPPCRRATCRPISASARSPLIAAPSIFRSPPSADLLIDSPRARLREPPHRSVPDPDRRNG